MFRKPLLHFLVWGIIFLYYLSDDLIEEGLDGHGLLLSFTYLGMHAVVFYYFFPRVWNKNIPERRWGVMIIHLLIAVLLFIVGRLLLEEVLTKALTGEGNYRDPWQIGYVYDNIFRPLPTILISLVIWQFQRQSELRTRQLELARESTEAQLGYLRSQVNPHFLFNTLGFIHSKVYQSDPEVAEMTEQISSILRRALSSAREGKGSLRDEISVIHDLYGIMQKRFPNACFVDIEVEGDLDRELEPLLLMPLAENLFKHGDLRDPNDPGRIEVKTSPAEISVYMRNKIASGLPPIGEGIGMENTLKRLKLAYPDCHSLTTHSENGYFEVRLNIRE